MPMIHYLKTINSVTLDGDLTRKREKIKIETEETSLSECRDVMQLIYFWHFLESFFVKKNDELLIRG